MRFARTGLLLLAVLGLVAASLPLEARTATRTRPSGGGGGGGGGTASRPPGGGGSGSPHHTQGKATWGYGGHHHGHYPGYGYGHYPYYGYGWGYPYYGWGGYYPYAGWGWGVGFGVGWAPYGAYGAVPVEVGEGGGYGTAWIETDVTPKRAIVRLDGEDVGFAKDWNGVWDRLPIETGEHVVEFVLEGYQTLQVHLEAGPGRVYRVARELRPGEGIDSRSAVEPPARQAPAPAPPVPADGPGYVRLRVEPLDAAVYLDGTFVGNASELSRRQAGRPLAAGEHALEVVRPGFVPERQTIQVDPGDLRDVRIELQPEAPPPPAGEESDDSGDRLGAGFRSRGSEGSFPA